MYFGMNELGKMQLGFARQSEPKLQHNDISEWGRNEVKMGWFMKERSQNQGAGDRRQECDAEEELTTKAPRHKRG
jgi:hypothetical protein